MGTRGVEPAPQEGAQAAIRASAVETPGGLSREGLSRHWRLTRASDLRAVTTAGRGYRTPRLDVLWQTNALDHPRVGLVVPKHGQSIVARNQLRRRLREIARRQVLPGLSPIDFVVRAKRPAYRATFAELTADLKQWARAFFG